jgi:hypothetical protein
MIVVEDQYKEVRSVWSGIVLAAVVSIAVWIVIWLVMSGL